MIKESIETVKHLFKGVIDKLSGGEKRRAAAEIAIGYGVGGQTFVAEEFGIGRETIRKGMKEVITGEEIQDKFDGRGRKSTLEKMPQLEQQIREILDSQSQADPKFQTARLFTNITAAEVRRQLIKRYGYANEELPTVRTMNTILDKLDYTIKTVQKTKPKKKCLKQT